MSAAPAISVCLCAHNPRKDYLARTLEALGRQTLAREEWELLVIDNASDPPLRVEPGLFPAALPPTRLIREDRLGLVRARLAAIAAAAGRIIAFFDDDNLPAADYLAQALRIIEEEPGVGVLGGRVEGEFEIEPPPWARPFLRYLAIREGGEAPVRSAEAGAYRPWHPIGAGMVLAREAAVAYAERTASDAGRQNLDRVGDRLTGGGDIDMVFSALDLGLAAAYDPRLRLRHLIPAGRLEFSALARLIYWTHYSCDGYYHARGLGRPARRWPIEYLTFILQHARIGGWRPRSIALAIQGARGRYAAPRLSPGPPPRSARSR